LVRECVNNESNVVLSQTILAIHLVYNVHQILSGWLPSKMTKDKKKAMKKDKHEWRCLQLVLMNIFTLRLQSGPSLSLTTIYEVAEKSPH
jgi:hypothetical protein